METTKYLKRMISYCNINYAEKRVSLHGVNVNIVI